MHKSTAEEVVQRLLVQTATMIDAMPDDWQQAWRCCADVIRRLCEVDSVSISRLEPRPGDVRRHDQGGRPSAAAAGPRDQQQAALQLRTLLNVGDLGPHEEPWPMGEVYRLEDYDAGAWLLQPEAWQIWTLVDPGTVIDPHGVVGDPAEAQCLAWTGKASSLAVGVHTVHGPWGELWMGRAAGSTPFTNADAALAHAASRLMSSVITSIDRGSMLTQLAYTDPLTGLATRRAFMDALNDACQAAPLETAPTTAVIHGTRPTRPAHPTATTGPTHGEVALIGPGGPGGPGGPVGPLTASVVMVDVIGLKAVNDSAGHRHGDDVLRVAAAAALAAIGQGEDPFAAARPGPPPAGPPWFEPGGIEDHGGDRRARPPHRPAPTVDSDGADMGEVAAEYVGSDGVDPVGEGTLSHLGPKEGQPSAVPTSKWFMGAQSRPLAARLGGDEFAVLLPGVGERRARRTAEAWRRRARESTPSVDLAVGVATAHAWRPGQSIDATALLDSADQHIVRRDHRPRST